MFKMLLGRNANILCSNLPFRGEKGGGPNPGFPEEFRPNSRIPEEFFANSRIPEEFFANSRIPEGFFPNSRIQEDLSQFPHPGTFSQQLENISNRSRIPEVIFRKYKAQSKSHYDTVQDTRYISWTNWLL